MRYFNTIGPVNESEHYVVPRSELIADLVAQIEQGRYFTIYAPRQMGKTTLLRHLRKLFSARTDYLPVTLSFEDFESLPAAEFLPTFFQELGGALEKTLQIRSHPQVAEVSQKLAGDPPSSFPALRVFLEGLHELLPESRLVLIIDEFDPIPQTAISPLLQIWRKIYLTSTPPRALHSVILIGLQNIAALNLGRSSPFNIARELQLPNFSLDQVRHLLGQYTAETAQPFAEGVVEEIHHLTDGYPFLVNRLAAILTEEMATDRSQPISLTDLEKARIEFIEKSHSHFDSLRLRASEYREDVLNILFGVSYDFNLNVPVVRALHTNGIIKKNAQGECQIANPIYEVVLLAAFRSHRWQLQADILVNGYDFRPHSTGSQLQIDVLLSRFRQFVERRGREAFKVTPTPQEATGQYLLMAYLANVVRQVGGDLFTEVNSGEGRLDLIVVHKGRRYVIETKIWYGQVEFDKGLEQLDRYLESEGQKVGYYVVFHARPRVYGKLTYKELEFTLQRKGKTIYVYLVRLGSLFQDKDKKQKTATKS